MNPMIGLLLVLVLLAGVGAARVAHAGGSGKGVTARRMKSMSTGDILRMLERIEREKEPAFVMGAMCYSAVCPPETAEYVCPVCGEKTLYESEDVWEVSWGLTEARNIFATMTALSDLEMTLDETGYCAHCRGPEGTPRLVLEISYEDGASASTIVTPDDLRLMAGVLSGELYYLTSNDSQTPLRPSLERLHELFGVAAVE